MAYRFSAPLTWPQPPAGWVPPQNWKPDPSWPPAPPGWQFWQDDAAPSQAASSTGWTQPPANSAPVYQAAAPVTRPVPSTQAVDTRLQAAVATYTERGYRVVSHQGSTVTMQRPATSFEWIWLIGSFIIGVGIGGLVYVVLWLLWRVPRNYSVDLSLNDYGQVVELGDNSAVFDRDRLKSTRIRSWFFGVLLVLFGLLLLGGLFTSPPEADENQLSTIITIFVVIAACAISSVLLLMSAMKATRQLRAP